MSRWLIDTNVVSELRRPRPAKSVLTFFRKLPLEAMHISIVSLAELRYGIACLVDEDKCARLRDWIDRIVRLMFEGRALSIDAHLACDATERSGGKLHISST